MKNVTRPNLSSSLKKLLAGRNQEMKMPSKPFMMGAVVGILVWTMVLPRVAPGLKAKLPLG